MSTIKTIRTRAEYKQVAKLMLDAGYNVDTEENKKESYDAIRNAGDAIMMEDGTTYENVYASRVLANMHEVIAERAEASVNRNRSDVQPLVLKAKAQDEE